MANAPATLSDTLRIGTVIETDLPNALARVRFGGEDEDDPAWESHWLDMATPRAGATRIWSPVSVGEQVRVECPDGDLEAAQIIGALWCDDHPAPGSTTRELIRFGDGCELAYDPESHHLEAILPAGGTITLTADGGITLNGPVTVNGDVTLNGTLTGSEDVIASGISLTGHTHGQVQAGSASTGEPQ